MASAAVRITSFGQGRFEYLPPEGGAQVREALDAVGVEYAGHRLAVNGHPTSAEAVVVEGDELTSVPRVQGG